MPTTLIEAIAAEIDSQCSFSGSRRGWLCMDCGLA